ncbi:SDR family NAD(P)-dependent oxidoreductase [Streptomyces sp. NPDC002896]|uniref:SDR family NAD(P)-dependent oxidoreductase n=1 Tax=Streptomyces sp. NPDC002896 TaxID=3154438 RepID=UPI0033240775
MTRLVPGQVAVVTGAASGIGKALAEAFAHRGLNLVIADVDANGLCDTRDELTALGVEVVAVPTDVTSAESVARLGQTALERFGTFDIVCNNVGAANRQRPSWEITSAEWERLLSLNLRSVINGIREFVPHLVHKNSGHVLNTASMSGLSIVPGIADYIVTKHAVVALTETLRAELAGSAPGVGATVLCPGIVRTPMSAQREEGPAGGANAPTASIPTVPAIEPRDAAEITLAAIEADYLYAVPAVNPLVRIRGKVDRLLHEVANQPVPPVAAR